MLERRYFDNAATSFPKPPGVYESMMRYATEVGASARGAYREAQEGARLVDRCRDRINALINGRSPEHVVFTLNTTDALNMAIKGVVRGARLRGAARPHVVCTNMEHNSVLRPFNAIVEDGATQTRVPADPVTGLVDPDDVARAITPDTVLVALNHASNVTGTQQDAEAVGRVARDRGVPFLLDAAQSLGHAPVDVQRIGADLLAFPGHKGLLGPQGTGGLYIDPEIEHSLATYREGGTGSKSELEAQPGHMPDRFESGSHNTVGIVGLSVAVEWVLERGVEKLHAQESKQTRRMLGALLDTDRMPGLTLIGPASATNRLGVLSFVHDTLDAPDIAGALESSFGILTRAGLHCAPLVHQTFGTGPGCELGRGHGATRMSLGPFLTEEDIDAACDALSQICRSVRPVTTVRSVTTTGV